MVHKKSLTEQATVLFVGNVIALLLGLMVPMVLVRVFTREEYGLYQQLFLVFTTMLPFGQMGVTQGLYYFLPREPEKKDAVVAQTLIFVMLTGVFFSIVLVSFRFRLALLMNSPEIGHHLPVVALYIMFMISSSFIETLMIAEGKIHLASVVRVVFELIRSLTVVVTALVTRSIYSIFIALVCFSLLRCVYQWVYLSGRYRLFIGIIDLVFWKRQLAYSIPIGLGNVAWLIQMKLHNFFVTFLFPPAIYAVYAIGTYNLPFLSIITTAVSNVMVPELSRCQKNGNTARIVTLWGNSLRKINFFFFPLFVFFFIMSREFIVAVFTEQYLDSVIIFRISLIGILIGGINTGAILNAYAETRYQMWIALFRVPVAIIALYFFTKTWGILGAVAANVSVSVFFRFYVLGKVSKLVNVPVMGLFRLDQNGRIMAVALIAGIPVLAVKHFVIMPPLLLLVLCATFFCLSYIMVGTRLGIISKSEVYAFLKETIPRFMPGSKL